MWGYGYGRGSPGSGLGAEWPAGMPGTTCITKRASVQGITEESIDPDLQTVHLGFYYAITANVVGKRPYPQKGQINAFFAIDWGDKTFDWNGIPLGIAGTAGGGTSSPLDPLPFLGLVNPLFTPPPSWLDPWAEQANIPNGSLINVQHKYPQTPAGDLNTYNGTIWVPGEAEWCSTPLEVDPSNPSLTSKPPVAYPFQVWVPSPQTEQELLEILQAFGAL